MTAALLEPVQLDPAEVDDAFAALVATNFEPPKPGPKRAAWIASSRPEQHAPFHLDGWFVWLALAGRGWGKTRTAAEHVAQWAREHAGAQIAMIGRTDNEARRVLLNGPSGLKSVLEDGEVRRISEVAGNTQVHFVNGSVVYVVGASSPDSLRGLNLDLAVCDELASWKSQNVIWSEVLMPAVRRGPRPHIVVTTTPKPTKLIRELVEDDTTHLTRGSTFDNADNLADAFIEQMRKKFDGTRSGRQELYAEVLGDMPGALLTRAEIEACRVDYVPDPGLRSVVVALDPSDGDEESDEQAIAVVGLGWDHDIYVTEVHGGRQTPTAYIRQALELAHELGAVIVVEKNHGGKYLTATIDQVMRDLDYVVPYVTVNASQSKRTRAEPVGALFEQGKAHLVGVHADTEDQLATWTGQPGEGSPDRLDAVVWGVSYFLSHTLGPEDADAGVHGYQHGKNAGTVRRGDTNQLDASSPDAIARLASVNPSARQNGYDLDTYLDAYGSTTEDDEGVYGYDY